MMQRSKEPTVKQLLDTIRAMLADGHTVEDIAGETGLSENSVWHQVYREDFPRPGVNGHTVEGSVVQRELPPRGTE